MLFLLSRCAHYLWAAALPDSLITQCDFDCRVVLKTSSHPGQRVVVILPRAWRRDMVGCDGKHHLTGFFDKTNQIKWSFMDLSASGF